DMINGLVDWRLISYDQMKKTYTAHPLIKSYFESDFEERNKKLCHQRIYAYFGENAPEEADTLEEMQPLFEQVYHGCAAGLYQQTLDEVFYAKIDKHGEHFLYQKLGAWETGLSLTKTFFPEGKLSRTPLLTDKRGQSWLLNTAGVALLNTGRPKEAEEPFLTGVKMDIEAKDWENVSVGYHNLFDLQFRTGEIESGLDSAQKALEMAEKVKGEFLIWISKVGIGWILYLLGESKEAENKFSQANELCIKDEGNQLRSLGGVQYADFLISMKRIDEALELTKQNFEICKSENWINDISRCYRCLGAMARIKENYLEAEKHLKEALKIARKVGMPELEIEALLESARLNLDTQEYEDAIRDASQALNICGRTDFIFYEPDAEIVLSKAYLAQKDFEQAETFANSAYEKAIGMKYRWPEGDAAHQGRIQA
ncbi:unnamed protein product, partial [marine sediment metagenome]